MNFEDSIIQRAIYMLDCFTSIQQIHDDDYSIVNITCTILYMSAKYDNRVASLDFYTFFAYLMRLDSYYKLIGFWDLSCSEINWPEMIFNRIEAMVIESFPKYQINLISPVEICYDILGSHFRLSSDTPQFTGLIQEALFNTYLCMSRKFHYDTLYHYPILAYIDISLSTETEN